MPKVRKPERKQKELPVAIAARALSSDSLFFRERGCGVLGFRIGVGQQVAVFPIWQMGLAVGTAHHEIPGLYGGSPTLAQALA
jgi:hypothetical protein